MEPTVITDSKEINNVIRTDVTREENQNQTQNRTQIQIQNQNQTQNRDRNLQKPLSQMQQRQGTRNAAPVTETEEKVGELRAQAAGWLRDFDDILKELHDIEEKTKQTEAEKKKMGAGEDTSEIDRNLSILKTSFDVKMTCLKFVFNELVSGEKKVDELQVEMTRQLLKQGGDIPADWEDQTQIASEKKHQKFLTTLIGRGNCSEYLQVKDESKQSAKQKIDDLNARITSRKEKNAKAKIIARNAEAYKNTNPEDLCGSMQYDNLKSLCIGFAKELWGDDKNRQVKMSEEYIIDNMAQNLLIFDIFDKYREKSKKMKLPEREQPDIKEAEQFLSYYKYHVETVLGDYGMSLSDLTYHPQKIEAILDGKKIASRTKKWEKDFKLYEDLCSTKNQKKDNIASDWQIIENNRLSTLERKAGSINTKQEEENDHVEELENGNQLLDDKKLKADSVLRLNGNIMNMSVNREREYIRAKRLYNVNLRFIDRLKEEGVWRQESEFSKISELCAANMEMYRSKEAFLTQDYEKEEQNRQREVLESLKKILAGSKCVQEKRYASILMNYYFEEQDGDLSRYQKEKKQECMVMDEEFSDMNQILADPFGKPCVDRFESVADQPLFEHKPTIRDVSQGLLGDCYFLSTLINVVSKNPDAIRNMMKDNHDGTVTVRFCDPDGGHFYVTVEKSIPKRTYVGKSKKINPYSRGALWVKMMEKAYAAVRTPTYGDLNSSKGIISYKDIEGGCVTSAMSHLMGLKTENHEITDQERREIGVFEGRLPAFCIHHVGKTVINSPSLLYYQKRHRMDKKNTAFRFLAGETVSKQQNDDYFNELVKYDNIEKMLELILIDQEGGEELRVMDAAGFVEASTAALESLSKMLDSFKDHKGKKLSKLDLEKAGVPKKLYSGMIYCWELCNRDSEAMRKIASEMLENFNSKLQYKKMTSEYTDAEEKFAEDIQSVLDKGGYVGLGTLKKLSGSSEKKGSAGENSSKGVYGNHAYTVLRIENYEINGRTKKFLVMNNPHGEGVPVYHFENGTKMKRIAFNPEDEKEEEYEDATHGEFLLELRDARSVMQQWISGEKR